MPAKRTLLQIQLTDAQNMDGASANIGDGDGITLFQDMNDRFKAKFENERRVRAQEQNSLQSRSD